MTILPKIILAVTLAVPLASCGHTVIPLQHHGNDALAVVYYDAEAKAFDICSRLGDTRNFTCTIFAPAQP